MIYHNSDEKRGRAKVIVDTFNIIQFFGWIVTLNIFVIHLVTKNVDSEVSEKTLKIALVIMKVVQTMQISDVLFAFGKLGGTNPISSLAQILSRLTIIYIFLGNIRDSGSIGLFLIPWSIGDAVRGVYYVYKNNTLLGHLRYNLFIFLYPMGVTGEVLLMEKTITNTKDLSHNAYLTIRTVQAIFIVGLFILYRHMILQRKKFYSSLNKSKPNKLD